MPSLDSTDTGHEQMPSQPLHPDSVLIDDLPVGVYACDPEGRITRFNRAAAQIWGREPRLGEPGDRFCGSYRLFSQHGVQVPHTDSPMAVALTTGQGCRDEPIQIERPDGTRASALLNINVLRNGAGAVTGAVSVLRESTMPGKASENADQRLAAIVASSDDAILSKDVNGIIQSWNHGAEKLFGYAAQEVIGKSVTILIPADRQDEEPEILRRVRLGERIEHYETVRQKKDGSLVDISLTVSPIYDANGAIVGASKIGRDISDRRRAEEQKDLLLREMNHRIKNLFALAGGLVNLTARNAGSASELVAELQSKFRALARAHSLTLSAEADAHQITTLHALIDEVIQPYVGDHRAAQRIAVSGDDVALGRTAVTNVALLLHEFATNALKYGALAHPEGLVQIACSLTDDKVGICWLESGAASSPNPPSREGFGSRLAQASIGALGGNFSREFTNDGLEIRLSVPKSRIFS